MQVSKALLRSLTAKYAVLLKLMVGVTGAAGLALVVWWATTAAPVQAQSEPRERQPPYVRPGVVLPDQSAVAKISPSQAQIVGGEAAAVGELPWQVVVFPGPFMCGGTLIDVNWVLTAAHCVFDKSDVLMQPGLVQIVAGEYNLASSDGTEQERGVTQVIPHPGYDAASQDNDLALLHLSAPVTLGPSVSTIARVESPANDSLVASGVEAMVSGWGALQEKGATSDILQKVSLPIVSNATCNGAYGGTITDNMLCAGLAAGGKDSCQGDSGGPLVVPDGPGWRLAGVVSFGTGCARPNYYGVYTRVSQYAQWIAGYVSGANPTATPTPNGTPSPTSTPVPTATANPNPSPNPSGNQVRNGTFEGGSNGDWSELSFKGYSLILQRNDLGGLVPHAGDWAAWLGGSNGEESTLTQDVVLNGRAIALTFYYQINSEDDCGYDTATVSVQSLASLAASGLPRTAAGKSTAQTAAKSVDFDLCYNNASSTWEQATLDLSEFANETVRLTFVAKTDDSYLSSLFVDDATITVGTGAATPTPQPTPQPLPQGSDYVYLPVLER
ncbi:MAG: trypsin-like serine protease [Caldilineaceae bacterium]